MQFDNHGIVKMTKMNYDINRSAAANPIKIQDVSLRDGHQSLFATRGRTEDMLPIAEMMDEIGFYSLEVWGGATFDVMHRFLNEDPWERLRTLKKYIKKTPFSMLLRGQNLVGYRNYADDVVENFVQRACDNGVDIFRVFDALNDFRNFEIAGKVILKNGKHLQGTICYSLTEPRMGGDVYNLDYYLKKAKDLEGIGVNSICIKDMAGLISPYDVYNLIRAMKEQSNMPIHLHTHFTSGMGDLAIFKAIEAGVDIVDTCMAPYAYRTSHPAIEPIVISLLGTNRDTGFNVNKLAEIGKKMEKTIPKYMHYANQTKFAVIDTNVILHQTPGGMLSNLVNQLRQMDALDKLDDVFETLPKVRKDLGQVPLVTPTSQIVGIQTVNNVLFDKEEGEYSKITEQVKDLCFGLYGKTTKPIDVEVSKKALSGYPRGETPITDRPGNILEPEFDDVKESVKDLAKDIDDELLIALYPVTGKRFLKWKYGHEEAPKDVQAKTIEEVNKEQELVQKILSGELSAKASSTGKPKNLKEFEVYVDGEKFMVEVTDPNMPTYSGISKKEKKVNELDNSGNLIAPIPGMIMEFDRSIGDEVKAGETIVVLEAMKMLNNLEAPISGMLEKINYRVGDAVIKGDILCVIIP
ncbi:MAG: pyruvate carboxylase subunit B [Candidatus Cloacimonetes bacterium]|nr:pyruvate carboxylase subunit B [Candidatus Cloacimonadota bacterium]